MNAKQYLKQIKILNGRIARNKERIKSLRESADGLRGIAYDGIKVQTSPTDSISEKIGELVELERKTVEQIIKLEKLKTDITDTINSLDYEAGARMLYLRYVEDFDFYDIAEELGYSLRQTHRVHGKALQLMNEKMAHNVT